MGVQSFFKELRRRNVYKVAIAYGITGWVVVQIASLAASAFGAPSWVMKMIITVAFLGLPVALVFAWAFEITADGIKRTAEIAKPDSISEHTGRKLNYWIIGLLSAALLILLVDRFWVTNSPEPPASVEIAGSYDYKASVAVLPFVDMSPGQDQEWFSNGLTDDILNSLTKIRDLKVIARTSSFAFKNKNIPVQIIADSLNVGYIVEGSVRRLKESNDLRVTAQLIRAKDAAHIWSHNFNRTSDDVFEIQHEIAESIASALDIYLDPDDRQLLISSGTQNIEAYEAYLKGKELYYKAHHSPGDIALLWKANTWFEKAIDFDPQFSSAYFYHHDLWAHRLFNSFDKRFMISPAGDSVSLKEAQGQLQQDLNNAIATSNGEYQRIFYQINQIFFSDNWTGLSKLTDRLFEESYKLNPSDVTASYLQDGFLLLGKYRQFLDLLHRIQDLNPLESTIIGYTIIRYQARAELGLNNLQAVDSLITVYEQQSGNYQRLGFYKKFLHAVRYPEKAVQDTSSLNARMLGYLVTGNKEEAHNLHRQLIQKGMDISKRPPREQIFGYFLVQMEERANDAAHKTDAEPFGIYPLISAISVFGGYLTFDLNSTPNLKARMKQAGIDVEEYNRTRQLKNLISQEAI